MDNNQQVNPTPEEPQNNQPVNPIPEAQPINNNTDDGKGMSIAALVLGILGIVGSFIPVVCYFTLVCAILGIVFGVKGRKKSAAVYGKASGLATAGLVLGIIGTAFAALSVVCVICAAGILGAASLAA